MELHVHIGSNAHAILLAGIDVPLIIAAIGNFHLMTIFFKVLCQIGADSARAGHTTDSIHQ